MASFIELTESQHSTKILVNLKEITFIEAAEDKKGKTTIIHFTSSTYSADRSIGVMEDYEVVKRFLVKGALLAENI